jgi:3-oxoacyl-[acyl-carrier protein] reductase
VKITNLRLNQFRKIVKVMMDLQGKVAIITGASRGIGKAIAELLGRAKAAVVVNYFNQAAKAQEVVETINQEGGKAIAVQGDMSKVSEIESLFTTTKEHFGQIDIVVNNAGRGFFKPHVEITEAEFDSIFNLNTKGAFFVMQQAAKYLTDGGRIVNIITSGTKSPMPDGGLYVGSKGASELFAISLSKELGPRGITVNNVSPGVTATDGLVLPTDALEELKMYTPLGRLGEPSDVANVVAFLVSQQGSWVNSQTIQANGGIV